MTDLLRKLFSGEYQTNSSDGVVWSPWAVWLHVYSDYLVALACFCAAGALIYFAMKRDEFPYRRGVRLFAILLVVCGISRLLEVWKYSQGIYELASAANAITALLAAVSTFGLLKLLPGILKLRSASELAELNRKLKEEIEKRKQADTGLQNERHLLRTLMVHLPDRIFFKDREGRFRLNSASHLKGFGLKDQSQTLGKTDADFFSKEHAQRAAADEIVVMTTGQPLHKEEKITWPDGRVDWAMVTKLPLFDEKGEVVGTFGIARDINEHKRVQAELVRWQKELEVRVHDRTAELARSNEALENLVRQHERTEEALRQSEERIRQVVEAMPSALMMVDAQGKIVLFNSQAERLFGYRRDELINQPMERLVPMQHRAQHPGLRAGFFAAPEARPMGAGRDLFGARKDGSEVPVEIGLNPIRTPDGSFVLATIIDITERKRVEQVLKDSLREKETLLKEVHHRVKNNLQIISSVLQLQSGYLDDARAAGAFRDCQHRIRSMALIHEALYRAGNFARFDFAGYVSGLVDILVRSYGSPTCAVKVTREVAAASVELDFAIPLALILNEAVSNSLKHAFRGQSQGNLWVRLRQSVDGEIELCVQDDGAGLPEKVDEGRPASLGLRLILILAEQLQGTIHIRRRPGTTITVTVPANHERQRTANHVT